MSAPRKATQAERAAHNGTYPLWGFVKVDGVKCDVEYTGMGDGGPNYEVRAPRGFIFSPDYTHGVSADTLADVRKVDDYQTLIPCDCCKAD